MRVLVVEDDASVASGIVDGLTAGRFDTLHVETGAAGLAAVTEFAPDVVLLDLGLPDMEGTDLCRLIRTMSNVPIIVVSARSEEIDRVIALEMGADDYLVKPFGMRELVARIRAVTRRASASDLTANGRGATELRVGALHIDLRAHRVDMNGCEVHLTPKEFDLLSYLATDSGAAHRRGDIFRDVWGTGWYGTTKTVDAHVAAIRKKLGDPAWIESVRGVGFRLSEPR
ncbi:response regulator transcription factor [Aeromicrobium sp.]|uniref:response regulator transcription factor n=1 Tax=Aeromicrobium sp. TaxID=1871063 RepID=UPI002FCA8D75